MGMRKRNDRAKDAKKIASLAEAGASIREIEREKGWSFHRAREAFKAWQASQAPVEPELDASSPEDAKPEKEKKKPLRISSIPVTHADLPSGRVKRYLFTAAQDDTPVHEGFLQNLEAYAAFIGAEIVIGGFTYQIGVFADHSARGNYFHARAEQYILHDRLQVGPDLLFVGTANILPTASNPLNKWMTVNHGGHVVIPHARVALESIPRMQGQPPRYAVSTGCVTLPNYTPRAAGQAGLFHHTYGAVLAEVDVDGEVFLRNVTATDDGAFQDLDVFVAEGVCHPDRSVRAMVWGDIHHQQLDPVIARATWGYDIESLRHVGADCLLDGLRPEYQFLHDTLDFRVRNHHDAKNPHQKARVLRDTSDSVEDEVAAAAAFVNSCTRDWCETVIIESNHDNALARWLACPDGQFDPANAYYWHGLNSDWHRSIRAGQELDIVGHALREAGLHPSVSFVAEGDSFTVDEIECGLHGHLGLGGSRGNPNQFRRLGVKVTSAHGHGPKWVEGSMMVGVAAKLEQGYNKGATNWAHAHAVHYYNGKRALILMTSDGRHRAMGDRVYANWPEDIQLAA